MDPDRCRDLPSQDQSLLLEHLGIHDPSAWEEGWRSTGVIEQTTHLWPEGAHSDWLWSLGLPILTEVMRHQGQRWLLGFSALPGCGKTSLGRWLEAAAERLGLSLQVMSIDDFYFSADALDRSMQGNPWGVPRALPGSHELPLLQSTLEQWSAGGHPRHPTFDKALRQGRGDRSGWRTCTADVIVLEGWFVGVRPTDNNGRNNVLSTISLSADEQLACQKVQCELQGYLPIWDQLNVLWQLRTLEWNSPEIWKRQQENQMRRARGAGLSSADLNGFIRMISAAIPQDSFDAIEADVCIDIDPDRRLRRLRVRS